MKGPSQLPGCKIEVPELLHNLLDRTHPPLAMTPQKRINIYIYREEEEEEEEEQEPWTGRHAERPPAVWAPPPGNARPEGGREARQEQG